MFLFVFPKRRILSVDILYLLFTQSGQSCARVVYKAGSKEETMSTVPISRIISQTIVWSATVTSVIAFIYAVISWCLIGKFRNLGNYVLFSVISASMLRFLALHIQIFAFALAEHIQEAIAFDLIYGLLIFFSLAFNCWLIVLTYIYYVDYVKVFDLDFSKKYLKINLFGWCLPLLETVAFFLIKSVVNPDLFLTITILCFMLTPLIISLINYLIVVYSVFRGRKSELWSSKKKWGRFGVSTLIFLVGSLYVITNLFKATRADLFVLYMVGEMEEYLLSVFVCVYIVFVRSGGTLWGEFVIKRSAQNSLDLK